MSIARNLASLFSASTSAATDSEVTAAIATHNTSANGHVKRGGTSSRPVSPSIGDIYYNTDLKDLEQYTEDGWLIVAKQPPRIPTIGTATLGEDNSVSISFTPSPYGQSASSYTAQSNPGSYTATGSSSPITFPSANLIEGTAYTFRVKGTGTHGDSAYSGYTGSVTPILLGNFESIATVTVGSGGSSTVTFSSIPSTYTHLQLRIFQNSGLGNIRFNSDTGSNYARHYLWGDGATATSGANTSQTSMAVLDYASTASVFTGNIVDILDYANTNKFKTVRTLTGVDTNGAGGVLLFSGLWRSTSAIDTITITGGTAAQYSSFALYGIKGA